MNVCKGALALSIVLGFSTSVLAQDPVKVDPAHYKVAFENSSVRVLRINYGPGEKSKPHQHPENIVIPLGASTVQFTTPDGKSEERTLASEEAMYAPAETHTPATSSTGRVDALLIEFKGAAGTATLPTSREGMKVKVLAEGPRAVAVRATADPTFHEPPGSKHEYDQVVVALGPSQVSVSLDGKPAKTSWARGDVLFIGRGVPHESKNAGGKPVEFIVVSIK